MKRVFSRERRNRRNDTKKRFSLRHRRDIGREREGETEVKREKETHEETDKKMSWIALLLSLAVMIIIVFLWIIIIDDHETGREGITKECSLFPMAKRVSISRENILLDITRGVIQGESKGKTENEGSGSPIQNVKSCHSLVSHFLAFSRWKPLSNDETITPSSSWRNSLLKSHDLQEKCPLNSPDEECFASSSLSISTLDLSSRATVVARPMHSRHDSCC